MLELAVTTEGATTGWVKHDKTLKLGGQERGLEDVARGVEERVRGFSPPSCESEGHSPRFQYTSQK